MNINTGNSGRISPLKKPLNPIYGITGGSLINSLIALIISSLDLKSSGFLENNVRYTNIIMELTNDKEIRIIIASTIKIPTVYDTHKCLQT